MEFVVFVNESFENQSMFMLTDQGSGQQLQKLFPRPQVVHQTGHGKLDGFLDNWGFVLCADKGVKEGKEGEGFKFGPFLGAKFCQKSSQRSRFFN